MPHEGRTAADAGEDRSYPTPLTANRDFLLFVATRLFNILGTQTLTVAVGWRVYQLTGDPFDLGLVGFAQFAPALALFLAAGYAADRFDRRTILVFCNAAHVAVSALLLGLAAVGTAVWPIFAVLVLHGAARAFFQPASQAILPNIVARPLFPNAVAYASSTNKIGQLVGPAVGGILIAIIGDWVYLAAAAMFAAAALASALITFRLILHSNQSSGLRSIFEGLGYMWRKKIVLGAISIDLLAVFFGGVMGLLPVFAVDVLHVGPEGLGLLRAAPAIGALGIGLLLAQLTAPGRMGMVLFVSLAIFGASIVVFSVSTLFLVSLAALALYGASDMVSVYVRSTLVQVATPDAMRGRVSSVNSVSINASNELGDFRAGVTAALIGTVPAVLVGGIVTVALAGLWLKLFPDLRRVDRLDGAG